MKNKNGIFKINKDNLTKLEKEGWVKSTIGQYKSSSQIKERDDFLLFTRRRNLKTFIDNFFEKSSSTNPSKYHEIKDSKKGSSSPMGSPKLKLTPDLPSETKDCIDLCSGIDNQLPILSSFANYPSLLAIRDYKPCLLIGFDSEWQKIGLSRDMLSYQFALVEGVDLVEFVFLQVGKDNLSLMDALGCILDNLENYKPIDIRKIRRYKYCSEWKNNKPVEVVTDNLDIARLNCKYVFRSKIGFTDELIQNMPDKMSNRSNRDWACFHTFYDYSLIENIDVCLVCHSGFVDLSALSYGDNNLLCHLTDIQGGLVSLRPIKYAPRSLKNVNNIHVYPISLSIADTMCHAPAKKKKLKDLGNAIGVDKVDVNVSQKSHMLDLLLNDPVLFMEYASTDSIITLLYSSAMYGYNCKPPITLTSASARVVKGLMSEYLGCNNDSEFNRIYRGLETIKKGNFKLSDRPGFIEATSLEPISNDVNTIQNYCSYAYHGGYNSCSEVGYFPFATFDYDMKNAYPTIMSLVPEINNEMLIKREVVNSELHLIDFVLFNRINPVTPFVGYIQFDFPESCKYPCIPINVDGVPQYPLSSEGLDGVYVAGPYIWLALNLGAKVYCKRGYFLNTLHRNNSQEESRSLSVAIKQLVKDRISAKRVKKGSLEELILKTMVNCIYGKNAQNVVQKNTWSAYKDVMEVLGCSSITNPFSAMMTTSIVQVTLIAAQNQIHEHGYSVYSVTTDGFISNCPVNIVKTMDLYGLRQIIEQARNYLTDGESNDIWEIKHHQDDLVNFTTRGNVSLRCGNRDGYDGVCAHNSVKSGFESDSYDDRLWLMTQVLSRTGPVEYTDDKDKWVSFKDFLHGKPFYAKKETHCVRMDFDMKRKPIRNSFRTDKVFIEGKMYEIAHFETEPFKNISEFRLYRDKKDLVSVLRTEEDWSKFWLKIDSSSIKAQPRDLNWSILNSCIMGYRMGLWDIPALNGKNVDEKCEWINMHNSSTKKFKTSDWKNARRPERQVNMLPESMIADKLKELVNDMSYSN